MRSFSFWQRWLWIASLGLVVFGGAMALLNRTIVFAAFNRGIDTGFWPAALPEGVTAFQGWAYGAWGATVAGWGLMCALLVRHAFARREAWSWWAMAASIGVWFILDTAISAANQVWANVILNTLLLVVFALPLAATRRVCLAPRPATG
jgi:hypothetical protein